MIAQVIEETTIWELSMMLEAINTAMVKGRILRSPSLELLYQGNKMMNYNKTVKDYGINSSTATRENPAVLYMTFKQNNGTTTAMEQKHEGPLTEEKVLLLQITRLSADMETTSKKNS
ncbi:hypothetical protein AVEN_130738-1 [Araneus ventricosus]|uniref:Ubiquitin-like domain-containing protein n=1 Tax=Araneus ventricosus TaxID=182803 RepID=A0A4Y2NMR0_ARAVE|nr:hypothetical protein AVEN_130738-1 [Araneus ventricosus]